ncbi:hypothetical protein D6829_00185 [Candidatus Pacearchaeota archaeon]|nr:MAG: hypothetical protein D6829_00185 [Candidatus Pacearchaeota archaeon]
MVEAQKDQDSFVLSDIGTRVRDLDEKSKLVRERVLLLGKNLIDVKKDIDEEITELREAVAKLEKDVESLKKVSAQIVDEMGKYVKRGEMIVLERMLRDFQPLEFMRRKDVEELIEEKLKRNK